jgi:long-chain acyl-CoA synthetase
MSENSIVTQQAMVFNEAIQNYLLATLGMEIHDDVSIPRVFLRTAAVFGKKPAVAEKVGGVYNSMSYNELLETVNQFAAGLIANDVQIKNCIAIFTKNCAAWTIADLGSLFAGCFNAPIYETLNGEVIQYILNETEAQALVVEDKEKYAKIADILPSLPNLRKVIVVHPEGVPLSDRVVTWDSWLAQGKALLVSQPEAVRVAMQSIDRDDIASVVYTSGTTGVPKGVILSHKNFLSQVYGILSLLEVGHEDRFLSILPLCHVLERTCGHFIPLLMGASVHYAENIKSISSDIVIAKPTICCSVPRVFEKIYAGIQEKIETSSALKKKIFHWALEVGAKSYGVDREASSHKAQRRVRHRPEEYINPWRRKQSLFEKIEHALAERLVFKNVRAKLGGSIRFFISGGAPLSPEIIMFFRNLGIIIYEGYGLTETSPIISFNYHVNYQPGTVGRLMPYVDVCFSEQGEILVKGPNVTRGYFKQEEATQAVFDAQGWFHTGDQGIFTEGNFLKITGRLKELIVTSGGKKVPLTPIEMHLNQHPLIEQSLLVGDNRNFITVLIFPDFIKLKELAQQQKIHSTRIEDICEAQSIISAYQAVIDQLNVRLSGYEKIRKFKLIPYELSIDKGELTPSMKLKRKIVTGLFQKEIDALYE